MKKSLAGLLGVAALVAFTAVPFRGVIRPAPRALAQVAQRAVEEPRAKRADRPTKAYSLRRVVPAGVAD